MTIAALRLERIEGDYCVCRLDPATSSGLPAPADLGDGAGGGLLSVTWTPDETSLVCRSELAPDGVSSEGPFAALRVAGTLDFSLTGVLSGLTTPLAAAGVAVFAVSTYDTDYLLVPEVMLGPAAERLREAGYEVSI
jgi:uncharacterized protein